MKKYVYIVLAILITSCDYLKIQTKKLDETEQPIATVYNNNLYKQDIENLLPKNLPKQDSLVLVKSIINSWATKQIMLKNAQDNISQNSSEEITDLVKKYEESLFINDYKERLIKQQLDTIVSEEEITSYYKKNKENFKLNEELLELKYIHFGKDFLDKKDAIKKFKSNKEEDLESLEDLTINFKSYELRDSIWVTVDEVVKKIPPFKLETKEKLLKISKFTKKQDSLGVYLVAVKNVLKRNDIAPQSYISAQIKQLILHQRKLELIREIEKTLLNDAIKNQHFKEY